MEKGGKIVAIDNLLVAPKAGNSKVSIVFLVIFLMALVAVITSASSNEPAPNATHSQILQDVLNGTINGNASEQIGNGSVNQTNATEQPIFGQIIWSGESQPQVPNLPIPDQAQKAAQEAFEDNKLLSQTDIAEAALPAKVNKTPQLARKINNLSIEEPSIKAYLELYKNFSDIKYEKLPVKSTFNASLAMGAKEDNLRGIEIADNRFAIQLLLCNHNTKGCAFRINGVATGAMSAINEQNPQSFSKFDLDENTTLQVNGIQLDHCDGRRFCNVYYEAYDIVNVTVITR